MQKYTKKLIFIIIFALAFNVLYIPKAFAAVSASSLVSMVNASRSGAGLAILSTNSQLESAAYAKANDMFTNQYFAHTSPQGKTPWDFIGGSGYAYVYAGENLAIGYSDSTELHNAWMNSPSHRENIMNPNFREVGIATVDGEYEGAPTTIVVQEFGSTDSSQPVAEINQNTNQTQQTVASASKSFTILSDKSSFSPAQVFVGDAVDFNVAITGDVSELYIMVGEQKIDLIKNIKDNGNGEKQASANEKINKAGDYAVKLTAIDSKGNKEDKDLGKLIVVNRVIIKGAETGAGFWGGIKNFINTNITYIATSIIITTLLIAVYLFIRYRKIGKLI
jgi:hypothetical protein